MRHHNALYIIQKKHLKLLILISMILHFSCRNPSNFSGTNPEISAELSVITYFTNYVEPFVIFNHKDHAADYYENSCMVCHSHIDVLEDSAWSCYECHESNLTVHDKTFEQCMNCHLSLGINPTPAGPPGCGTCHDP